MPAKLDDKSAAGCWTVDRRRRTFTEAAGKKLEILEKVRNGRREGKGWRAERRRTNENGKFRLGGQMSVVAMGRNG